MAAHTRRMVLKEILIEDLDKFLKPETEAIQNEREETGMSQRCGLLSKLELELSDTDGGCNLSGRGSHPHDLGIGLSRSPSMSKGNLNDARGSCNFPESGVGTPKNPCRLRRLEDAIVILGRLKDPRPILSNVVRTTTDCCEAADEVEDHLKGTMEPINTNAEEESKLALAANVQESSVDIARSTSVVSLESSFGIEQESVAIEDGGTTQTCQGSSNSSSNSNSLKKDKMTLRNQHFSEKPTGISHLQEAITASSTELTSDRPVTRSNLEGSMSRVAPSELSSSVETEVYPAQSSEAYDFPTPVSMTASPEDTDWWRLLPQSREFEAGDGKEDVDDEVLLNYSRMNDFETYLGLCGQELGSTLNMQKEIDRPKSPEKKLRRLLRGNASEPQSPATSCDKCSVKKRNCTRTSPRLKRISGIRLELESKDAIECSKEGIEACKETDEDAVEDQLNFEDKMLIEDVCQPMSLRSRSSSEIQVVNMTSDKVVIDETKAEILLGDLSFKEELKHQSQYSVRKTNQKLRTKRPPLLRCDWLVGDLLWAKMAGHPWWPCILTYDPSLGLYTRSSTVGRVIRTRFHVRFFGEKPYRAWIADGSILQFNGVEAFKRLCAQMSKTDLVRRSQNYYKIVDSRRKAWDMAVEEAEKIVKLTRKDRLLRCNSVSGTDSTRKSTADETGRSRQERGKSMSYEKVEQKTPECKKRRQSEPRVQRRSRAKDPLSPDDSWRLTDRMEDQDGNCKKEESKPEALKLIGGVGGGMRKGTVCLSCELDVSEEELVSCEGSCLGGFHRACLGLAVGLPMPFVCDECTTGSHTCFVCKVTSVETLRCSVSLCGRFYHLECIKKLRLAHVDKRRLQCPLHTCATCTADDIKNPLASKGSLLRCVRCPTAYHSSDVCLAAGSERLAGNAIVCSRHLMKSTSQQHVNVNWCFLCSKGGTLLCCESCPAAFHMDCLKLAAPPVGSWECEECADGKRPLYGEIVWAKLGNYRWWPGEIYHPRNIPDSLMGAAHQKGEFPVRFFGSHNYFWANIGRVFLFQEDDKGSKESIRNGLDKSFSRAVEEANAAIRVWMAEKEKRDEKSKAKADRKPPPYKHLKASVVVGDVSVYRFNLDDIHPCSCHVDMVDPCGPESKCLNRDLSYECHPDVCPVGNHCQNRRFQRREYASVVPFKTETRGWGLRTLANVKEGQFVIEYVGELIDLGECRRRMKEMQMRKNSSFYLLTLDKDRIIDAGPRGNVSRFMNHSCQPNCETQKWTVNGELRIGLFSIVDIPAGSELTFNYNLDCLGNEKLACHCGSAICSGYLGLRPKQSIAVLSESSKRKRKRRVKKSFGSIHDDECFRCGKTGQLIMCDKNQCPKVYHLKCLHLTKAPHGKWICPWHHCDECGQPSTRLCNECDNSFCVDHVEGNISEMLSGYLICSEHDEWKPADDPSYECSVETVLDSKESRSEKLGLCGMEVGKTVEGKLEDNGKNSKAKRNWRSSLGMSEKNASGKTKRELSTGVLIQNDSGTKLLEKALKHNASSVASNRESNNKGSSTSKKMLPDILSQNKDGSKLSRTEEKTSRNSGERKRNGKALSLAVSEKNSSRKYQTKRRRKSLPENQTQSEAVVECFRTESELTSSVSSKCNRNRRQTISVINFKGVAKLERKIDKSSGDLFTVDSCKNEDVAELSVVKIEEGNEKMKRKSRKLSLLVMSAKRTKTECVVERGHVAVPRNSTEDGLKGTKEFRRNSLKIKDTEEGKKCRKLLRKPRDSTEAGMKGTKESVRKSLKRNDTEDDKKCRRLLKKKRDSTETGIKGTKVSRRKLFRLNDTEEVKKCQKPLKKTGVGASKKELRISKKSLVVLKSSLVFNKTSVVLKKKLGGSKCSNFPLKISKTSRKKWIGETQKSKYAKDLQKALELSILDMQHEAEFRNNALKSFSRKLKPGEEQKRRKSRRFMKQSDRFDCGNMETEEEETLIKLTDGAQIEAMEITSLVKDKNSSLLSDVPVAEQVKISCESENEVSHLEMVTDVKSKIEEDFTILKVQDEAVNHPVKLTKKKVSKIKRQRFGSGRMKGLVMLERSFEEKSGLQTETNNLEIKEDIIQDLEVTTHSGLHIEAKEIEAGSQKDLMNLKEQGVGMGSEKEKENFENVSACNLQKEEAVGEISDDSTRGSEGIISETAKNIHNLPNSLVIDRYSSKFKSNFYDTPSDSCESDVVFLQNGDCPDVKDSTGWGKGTEQNVSESGSSFRSKGDKRQIIFEADSIELEINNCLGTSAKMQEECLASGKFPVRSKDVGMNEMMTSVGTNAVMIYEAQLLEVLQPAGSVGKVTDVEGEVNFTDRDGVASSFVADGSFEIRTVSGVEEENGPGSSVEFFREPGWKRNNQISSGNASLKPKDGGLKDCDVFPRTY